MRVNRARRRLARERVGRPAREARKQLGHPEILQRAAEDDRRKMPFEECLRVERREITQAQFEAFQRGLRDAVLNVRVRVQSLNGRQCLHAAE